MITSVDIAWAAGIYEGEGCFIGGHTVRVVQKDSWLVYELQKKFGGKVKQYTRSTDGKEYHFWTVNGAKCRGFLLSIFSLLSPRRKSQILRHPLFFKDSNFVPPQFRTAKQPAVPSTFCSEGHPKTPENIFIEKGFNEKGEKREWRTCKICRKAKYDKKNQKRQKESHEWANKPVDEKMIDTIAKARKISIIEAKAIWDEALSKRIQ